MVQDIIIQTEAPIVESVEGSKTAKRYEPVFAELAGRLVAAKHTENDLGYIFGVSPKTIKKWKQRYPLFKQACEEGRRYIKKQLVAKGLQAAIGYTCTEKKVKRIINAKGEVVKEEETVTEKAYPPNDKLLAFFLLNIDRQMNEKDWQNVAAVRTDGDKHLTIVLDGKIESKRIESFCQKMISGETENEGNR